MGKDTAKKLSNPFKTVANAVGIKNNTIVGKAADWMDFAQTMGVSQFKQAQTISDVVGFNEGSKITREIDGQAGDIRSKVKAANKQAVGDANSDAATLDLFKTAGDTLSSGADTLLTPQVKTASGQSELQRLLSVFEGRSSALKTGRQRPGASQTRLV